MDFARYVYNSDKPVFIERGGIFSPTLHENKYDYLTVMYTYADTDGMSYLIPVFKMMICK